MSLLDDPALRLRATDRPSDRPLVRVRLRSSSAFARDLRVPPGSIGEVRGGYVQDGERRLNVWVDGTGMLFGVPRGEVDAVGESGLEPRRDLDAGLDVELLQLRRAPN